MKKILISRYYRHLRDGTVLKCIDKVEGIYFFKRVDDGKYSKAKCDKYRKSSKLCKKCNKKTTCFASLNNLKEIPYLKAVLLYEK